MTLMISEVKGFFQTNSEIKLIFCEQNNKHDHNSKEKSTCYTLQTN